MADRRTKVWLNTLQSCSDHVPSSKDGELFDYLVGMNKWMQTKDTVSILKQDSEIGQLLSCLSKNGGFLGGEGCIEIVAKCILSLSKLPLKNNQPQTAAERRSQSWAINQIHNISKAGYCDYEKTIIDQFQVQPLEYHTRLFNESISYITNEMEDLLSKRSKSGPEFFIPGVLLRSWADRIFPFLGDRRIWPLVSYLLELLKYSIDVPQIRPGGARPVAALPTNFIDEICHCGSLYKELTYAAKVSLWRTHLPSFEDEILPLVELTQHKRPLMSQVQMKDMLQEKIHVVSACAEYQDLCWYAFEILRFALARSMKTPSLVCLVSSLASAVWEHEPDNIKATPKNFLFFQSNNMACQYAALLMLRNNPYEMPTNCLENCLLEATSCLLDLSKENYAIKEILTFFLQLVNPWVDASLLLLITGSQKVAISSIKLLIWYFLSLDALSDSRIVDNLTSFSLAVRGFTTRSDLTSEQISCLVHNCCSGTKDNRKLQLLCIHVICIAFLKCYFLQPILKHVYLKVTEDLHSFAKLDIILRSLESLLMFKNSTASNFNHSIIANILELVKIIANDIEREHGNEFVADISLRIQGIETQFDQVG